MSDVQVAKKPIRLSGQHRVLTRSASRSEIVRPTGTPILPSTSRRPRTPAAVPVWSHRRVLAGGRQITKLATTEGVVMSPENRYKQKASRKAPSSAWRPGQSGNPGGRPKVVAEIRQLAREHGSAAIRRLVDLMSSRNETVVVRACEALLDRGYGRSVQGVELNSADATSQRWHVVLVPTPKRENTLPSSENLPSNGIAQLTHGPSHTSAGRIIS